MIDWLKERLVPEAKQAWRFWSLRFNAIGLAILGWLQADPSGAMAAWNSMPAEVRDALPPHFITAVPILFFALGFIARVVKQPTLEKPHGE